MNLAICLLVSLACLWTPVAAGAAAPQPRVVGNHLVDAATGQTFVPRGVNWPSFEYACLSYAYSNDDSPTSVGPSAAGAAVIAGWHVNTVRIPLNQDCWLGDDGQPANAFPGANAPDYRFAVGEWVDRLHAAGLAVILDLHWSGPAGVVADGQRAMPDDRSDDFWTGVATQFKDDPSVIFDAFNEPYSRPPAFDLTWGCWRDGGCTPPRPNDEQPLNGTTFTALGMQQLVTAIRATGAQQPILLNGRDYANDDGQWLASRPADNQLVAGFHTYDGQSCNTAACYDATIAPIAAQVPVVAGEFGAENCSEAHDRALMDWGDAHGVGYLAWAWWILPDSACSQLALIADPKGTPRAPNGTALKAHLDALVQQGAIPANPANPGGGTTGPAGTGPSGTTRPGSTTLPAGVKLALGGRTRQKLGRRIKVLVTCAAACRARVTGRLRVRSSRRSYALRAVSATLAAGKAKTLSLALSKTARRAASAGLRRHRRVTAALTVTAGGATAKRTVTLTR